MLGKPSKIRRLRRSRQIMAILAKHGLDYFLGASIGGRVLRYARKKELKPVPERLREAIEELGPTFIKFGQILSTRSDILPPVFIAELSKLQDQVRPFDSRIAQAIVEEELGQSIESVFAAFETEPIATASLSQIHRATLPSGETVAVKIQKPDIVPIIDIDLDILESLARLVNKHLNKHWAHHAEALAREIKRAMKNELDYNYEAGNFERFEANFRDIEYIRVPKVYREISTDKVLVMEYIDGVKVNEINKDKYRGVYEPKEVARRGAAAILKQIFEDGFFHADPHPANLFILPSATIVMLDVGMVGFVDKRTVSGGTRLIAGAIDNDPEKVIAGLEELGVVAENFDRNILSQDIRSLLNRYLSLPLKKIKFNQIAKDTFEMVERHDLALPANLVLIMKAVSVIETVGQGLDPDLDAAGIAKPFIAKLLKKKYEPEEIVKRGGILLHEYAEMVEKTPGEIMAIAKKLNSGRLRFNIDHHGLEKLSREIHFVGSRLSLGIIIAALLISSSLLMQTNSGPLFSGQPLIAIIGYILAILLGLILIF